MNEDKKQLPGRLLPHVNVGGYSNNQYYVVVDPGTEFEDLFRPEFWIHHTKLQMDDRIRVRDSDRTFDVELTVVKSASGKGVTVRLWPIYPNETAVEAARAAAVVADQDFLREIPLRDNGEPKVRVEFLTATKWRVRGIDDQEVSRDHETREEAERAMEAYVREMRLCWPHNDKITSAKAEHAEKQAAKKARSKAA